ncbi:helix-turn-helix transcriptional regulator [Siphonobacter sp. SORGH_AS_1065]|uniref:helix-turn-helix domain-containing protein n=1 Tax=Siphonobacter sp. SORGH_AS_1065 TaxID=3041795 RepID=UPI0027888C26|nr:helix-turn-helix transcriptional regulator [Siphonobacter sp. SORGH_AS_1065]MDQ1088280.1 transcriptional regulator with XRE-family HTH domain [Siphonobacter sp. SORGH_AS_1065]
MEQTSMATIYERLSHLIQSKKLTPYRFSQELGFSKPAKLYSILKGKTQPSYDTLLSIASVYDDLDCNWLLRGTGNIFIQTLPTYPSEAINAETNGPLSGLELLQKQIQFLEKQVHDRDEVIALLKEQIVVLRDVIGSIKPTQTENSL